MLLKRLILQKFPIRADTKQRANSHSLKTKFHTYSHCQTTTGLKRPQPPATPDNQSSHPMTTNITKPTTKNGGGGRNRTDDLLRAKQALSQLSYAPNSKTAKNTVGPGRLELPTSRLSSARSNQLSYKPVMRIRDTQTAELRTIQTLHCKNTRKITPKVSPAIPPEQPLQHP